MNITTTYDEAMVKAMIAEAVAKEREECAKVCDERAQKENLSNHRRCDADALARAIRARKMP